MIYLKYFESEHFLDEQDLSGLDKDWYIGNDDGDHFVLEYKHEYPEHMYIWVYKSESDFEIEIDGSRYNFNIKFDFYIDKYYVKNVVEILLRLKDSYLKALSISKLEFFKGIRVLQFPIKTQKQIEKFIKHIDDLEKKYDYVFNADKMGLL